MELNDIDREELHLLRIKQDKQHAKKAEWARNYYNRMKEDPLYVQHINDRVKAWVKLNKLKHPKLAPVEPKRKGRPPAPPKAPVEPKKRGRPIKVYNYA